jgi:hypothetical protein
MSTPNVAVSRYSLTIDTMDTFAALFHAADNENGDLLLDALNTALCGTYVYAVPEGHVRTPESFRISNGELPDLPLLKEPSAEGLLATLETAGYLTARTELFENSEGTYLSEGRAITAVHVTKPFAVVAVKYEYSAAAHDTAVPGRPYHPDIVDITHEAAVVPEGWYLVCELADTYRTPALIGAVGMTELSDDVVAWLFDLEGFGASTCLAGCDNCGGRWRAESGNWEFNPDECDSDAWYFDNAEDFLKDTIACPSCQTGRVGFLVC